MAFFNVPVETILKFTHFLELEDLAALAHTCRKFKEPALEVLYNKAVKELPQMFVAVIEAGFEDSTALFLHAGAQPNHALTGFIVLHIQLTRTRPGGKTAWSVYRDCFVPGGDAVLPEDQIGTNTHYYLFPLHMAAVNDQAAVAQLLISEGVRLDVPSSCFVPRSKEHTNLYARHYNAIPAWTPLGAAMVGAAMQGKKQNIVAEIWLSKAAMQWTMALTIFMHFISQRHWEMFVLLSFYTVAAAERYLWMTGTAMVPSALVCIR